MVGDGIVEGFRSVSATSTRARRARPLADRSAVKAQLDVPLAAATPESERLAARLREWRTTEAKRQGVPAYVVLHDRTLSAVALARPANSAQLLAIVGVGPAKVEKYGAAILQLCASETAPIPNLQSRDQP
jgi:superfamily II DNA helicase RecQ